MKKKVCSHGAQTVRLCAITLALFAGAFFAACNLNPGGTGNGIIPVSTVTQADIERVFGKSVYPEGCTPILDLLAGDDCLFPIVKIMGKRHDKVDDKLLDEIEDAIEARMASGGPVSFVYGSGDGQTPFPGLVQLQKNGITGVTGKVAGSGQRTEDAEGVTERFAFSEIALEYNYDSASDAGYKRDGYVKGWVRATGSTVEEEWEAKIGGNEKESEEEAMVITFVVAFKDGLNAGKIAAELGYSYREEEVEVNGKEDRTYANVVPDLRAVFRFYNEADVLVKEVEVKDAAALKKLFKFYD